MADMDDQENDREQFGGDSDFGEDAGESPSKPSRTSGGDKGDIKAEPVGNMPFDEAINVDGSESVESDQDDEGPGPQPSGMQIQAQQKAMGAVTKAVGGAQTDMRDDEGSGDEGHGFGGMKGMAAMPANAYNPMDYANLKVSTEISELFQYISRYHPHNIELDTKLKPFIPEYIPAVGEVDAFLKVPRPDGVEETLGLTCLDEPTINPVDPSVLEMQYIQTKKQKQVAQVQVRSLEMAEQNPKQVQQWVNNVNELHKTRPPPTVQFTKNMPDIESLMQEWAPEMEDAFSQISLPGPDLDLSLADYAKMVCVMLDIPVHKLANKKSVIEALHHLFSLYAEFKENPHFGRQKTGMEAPPMANPAEEVNYMKIS